MNMLRTLLNKYQPSDVVKAGILKDIMWLPANDVYIVLNGDKESLIPVIDEIIIRLDLESKKIIIADIDGLLDI